MKQIVESLTTLLNTVNVTDPANDKVGGVSVTSKHKGLLAALAVNLSSPEISGTEPLVIRKIIEALLTGKLIIAGDSAQISQHQTSVLDPSQYVSRQEYERMANEYNRIFEEANSENIVILSQEELDSMSLSEAQISQIVDIAQEYDKEGAALIIKQYLYGNDEG